MYGLEDSEKEGECIGRRTYLVWRRAAAGCGKVRWIGFSLFCVEFVFHFKIPWIYDCIG